MPTSVNCSLIQYADDSALMVSGKNPDVIASKLCENLESCNEWLIDNKLSLHMGKTELIMFGSKNKLKKVKDFSITCKGHNIKATESVKYLGLQLNQTLSGIETVNNIVKKTNEELGKRTKN